MAPARAACRAAPPASITPTKASGHAQIALPPFSAAHSPTAIITVMWSSPDSGCMKPAANDDVVPAPTCASAGKAAAISRTAATDILLDRWEKPWADSFYRKSYRSGALAHCRAVVVAQHARGRGRIFDELAGRADRPPRKFAAAIRAGAAEFAAPRNRRRTCIRRCRSSLRATPAADPCRSIRNWDGSFEHSCISSEAGHGPCASGSARGP